MLPRWAVIGLAALVSLMWAINLTVGYLYPGRNDPFLNYIFGMVIGAIFGIDRLAHRRTAPEVEPPEPPAPELPAAPERGESP